MLLKRLLRPPLRQLEIRGYAAAFDEVIGYFDHGIGITGIGTFHVRLHFEAGGKGRKKGFHIFAKGSDGVLHDIQGAFVGPCRKVSAVFFRAFRPLTCCTIAVRRRQIGGEQLVIGGLVEVLRHPNHIFLGRCQIVMPFQKDDGAVARSVTFEAGVGLVKEEEEQGMKSKAG